MHSIDVVSITPLIKWWQLIARTWSQPNLHRPIFVKMDAHHSLASAVPLICPGVAKLISWLTVECSFCFSSVPGDVSDMHTLCSAILNAWGHAMEKIAAAWRFCTSCALAMPGLALWDRVCARLAFRKHFATLCDKKPLAKNPFWDRLIQAQLLTHEPADPLRYERNKGSRSTPRSKTLPGRNVSGLVALCLSRRKQRNLEWTAYGTQKLSHRNRVNQNPKTQRTFPKTQLSNTMRQKKQTGKKDSVSCCFSTTKCPT